MPRVYINLVVSRHVNTSHSYDYAVSGSGKCAIVTFMGQPTQVGTDIFALPGILTKDETRAKDET